MDLRSKVDTIIYTKNLNLNPIATIAVLLKYQLKVNKLEEFLPSILFIYKNCQFYNGIDQVITYDSIFKSIENNGFCKESDFSINSYTKDDYIDNKLFLFAKKYKYIRVYRIVNSV